MRVRIPCLPEGSRTPQTKVGLRRVRSGVRIPADGPWNIGPQTPLEHLPGLRGRSPSSSTPSLSRQIQDTQLRYTERSTVDKQTIRRDKNKRLASLPPEGGSVVPGWGSPDPRTGHQMKDPRRESSFWRDTSQGSTRTPLRMQTARGLFSDTQAPGVAESLRGLARPQAVVRGFYKGREQKARLQKQMPWLQGFHWTA